MARRTRKSVRHVAVVIAGAYAVLSHAPLFAQTSENILSPGPGQTVTQWLATLRNPAADRADRLSAASRLLSASTSPDTAREVAALLGSASEDIQARAILLDAIARMSVANAGLFPTVSELAASASAEDLPTVIAAMASFRTAEAAVRIAAYLGEGHPQAVRQAAVAGLVRLSGRDDFAVDAEALATWIEFARRATPGEWSAALIRDLGARADRLAADRESIAQQHVTLLRRHAQDQAPEVRHALIADLLRAERDELRALGFELIRTELERTPRVNGPIAAAAIDVLRDRNPRWRERAAALVDQLAPANAGPAVVDALNRETDARAASVMLTAATRWPTIAVVPTALRWLEAGPTTRRSAALLALTLIRQDILKEPGDLARIAATLRAMPLEQFGATTLRLLMAVGDPQDHARIAGLLGGEDAGVRQAAALALADRAEGLDLLLEGAARDAVLFEIAATAVTMHRPTEAGYDRLASLPASSDQLRRAALLRLAAALNARDLVRVAQRLDITPETRIAMLGRLTEPQGEVNGPQIADLILGLVMLAESHLELGRPDLSLVALEAARRVDVPADSEQATRLRRVHAATLIAMNHLDEAQAMGATVRAWLEGLSYVLDEPFAHDVVARILAIFGESLTPDERATLAELERAIPRSVEAPGQEPQRKDRIADSLTWSGSRVLGTP